MNISESQPKHRFRWRIIPAALSWGFGGIILISVPLIVIIRWKDVTLMPVAYGMPSALFLLVIAASGAAMVFAGSKWNHGKWLSAIVCDVIAYGLLVSVEPGEDHLLRQKISVNSRSSNQGGRTGKVGPPQRLSYEESCRELMRNGHLPADEMPAMPDHRPQYDDDELRGVRFYRMSINGSAIESMNLPRTIIRRSEVGPVSFRNSNLSESTLCWNDFKNVDFTAADLSNCDLRSSIFDRVNFEDADLTNSDLRRSDFQRCNFRNATMRGVKMTRTQSKIFAFSRSQIADIDWQDSEGEEPGGGWASKSSHRRRPSANQ